MKRLVGTAIALCILLLCFSGCGQTESTSLDFRPCVGKRRETALKQIGLSEKDASVDEQIPWELTLNQPQPLYGRDFTVTLLSNSKEDDTVYGYRYRMKAENPAKEDLALVQTITEDLTKSYGEPSTYPGTQNRIAEHLEEIGRFSREDLPGQEPMTEFREQWDAPEVGPDFIAELNVSFFSTEEEGFVLLLNLTYQPDPAKLQGGGTGS